jgi:hypothetical protein
MNYQNKKIDNLKIDTQLSIHNIFFYKKDNKPTLTINNIIKREYFNYNNKTGNFNSQVDINHNTK